MRNIIKELICIILFFLSSCLPKNVVEETESKVKMNKENKIELVIISPSKKCTYKVVFKGDFEKGIYTKNDLSKEFTLKEDDKNLLYTFLDKGNELEKGKLWKGGWHYVIYINNIKRYDFYEKNESNDLLIIYKMCSKYIDDYVDYNCF